MSIFTQEQMSVNAQRGIARLGTSRNHDGKSHTCAMTAVDMTLVKVKPTAFGRATLTG